MGSGKWPTTSIRYAIGTDVPSSHVAPIQNSAQWWTDKTDIDLIRDSSSQINALVYDYGYTSWDGLSYMNPGWNSTFQYGNFQLNYYFTKDYSSLHIQLVAAHEFGHELSLNHVSSYVMMYGSDVWYAYQQNSDLANGPQQDDINGINNRY